MTLIPLSKGNYAAVDAADYQDLSQYTWHVIYNGRAFYAARTSARNGGNGKTVLMHRQILGVPGKVDHVDGDTLNNRRGNLRAATTSQNGINMRKPSHGRSSIFKGVSRVKGRAKWQAFFASTYLGSFSLETDAACAYDAHVLREHSEFARPNLWRGML